MAFFSKLGYFMIQTANWHRRESIRLLWLCFLRKGFSTEIIVFKEYLKWIPSISCQHRSIALACFKQTSLWPVSFKFASWVLKDENAWPSKINYTWLDQAAPTLPRFSFMEQSVSYLGSLYTGFMKYPTGVQIFFSKHSKILTSVKSKKWPSGSRATI